jgi:hypothetical protein
MVVKSFEVTRFSAVCYNIFFTYISAPDSVVMITFVIQPVRCCAWRNMTDIVGTLNAVCAPGCH